MESRLTATLGTERVAAGVTSAFAAVALLLSAIGISAILAHSVAARKTEIGIRMAIGAQRNTVVRMIVRQGLQVVGVGLCAGLIGAAAGGKILASQLYEIDSRDPVIYAVVAGLFGIVAVAPSLVPAMRASRVDPLSALQHR
jgi:ABC-type antimicrobial peptide transport system permease subunit